MQGHVRLRGIRYGTYRTRNTECRISGLIGDQLAVGMRVDCFASTIWNVCGKFVSCGASFAKISNRRISLVRKLSARRIRIVLISRRVRPHAHSPPFSSRLGIGIKSVLRKLTFGGLSDRSVSSFRAKVERISHNGESPILELSGMPLVYFESFLVSVTLCREESSLAENI